MHRFGFLCVVLAVTAAPLAARHDTGVCGTTAATPAEVMFLHRQAERARAARRRPLAPRPPFPPIATSEMWRFSRTATEWSKNSISSTSLPRPSLSRLPAEAARAIATRIRRLGYDATAAAQGSPVIALGDDDSRQFPLPFAFPFYGDTYRQVFLNSDGNLTFTAGDDASSGRTVGRMTGGPPRISPLFDDLDPSQSAGSVRFFAGAGYVVFSWVSVPEYGPGAPQTFQVRLSVDGSIQFSYSSPLLPTP